MGLFDGIRISQAVAQHLKITCPRCGKMPDKDLYCQSDSTGGYGDEYRLVVQSGSTVLLREGNMFGNKTTESKVCPDTHGWVHMVERCYFCEGYSLYDLILRFTDGVVDVVKTDTNCFVSTLFGAEKKNDEY